MAEHLKKPDLVKNSDWHKKGAYYCTICLKWTHNHHMEEVHFSNNKKSLQKVEDSVREEIREKIYTNILPTGYMVMSGKIDEDDAHGYELCRKELISIIDKYL